MKAYYITVQGVYVQALTYGSDGIGFIPIWDKEDAGIFEIEKCNALKNDLLEKSPLIVVEFEEFVKEER